MRKIIAAIVGGIFSAVWKFLFPPKTAADQQAADRAATTRDANDAIKTNEAVDRESLSAVQSDLDRRMRDTGNS